MKPLTPKKAAECVSDLILRSMLRREIDHTAELARRAEMDDSHLGKMAHARVVPTIATFVSTMIALGYRFVVTDREDRLLGRCGPGDSMDGETLIAWRTAAIKKQVKRYALDVATLAQDAGISRSHWYKIASGKGRIKFHTAMNIAMALKVRIKLMDGDTVIAELDEDGPRNYLGA